MNPYPQNLTPIFGEYANRQIPIRLFNHYRGMPVINDGWIERVDGDGVLISTHKNQIACLYLSHSTVVELEALQLTISARVIGIQLASRKALLGDFQAIPRPFIHRAQIRVEPEVAVQVFLRAKSGFQEVYAAIKDLSTQGLGIYLERSLYHPRLYPIGGEIQLRFSLPVKNKGGSGLTAPLTSPNLIEERFSRENIRGLPQGGQPQKMTGSLAPTAAAGTLNLRGIIRNVRPELGANRYRLGVLISAVDESSRLTLYQYMAQRQAELIRELNTLYEGIARLGS
ncbi:protein containing PilZ domain [Bellilinea caldifistulae]|uniref:PilZ domain-containing protein n=1 Tax=Bellilinea caldifistulae TaxID=360411 RepID=A0A0P6XQL1_9CHLR|nr:PilZ domain-containing protein [Bellilinea caldifistulae]KPL77541.1 hypothetical protein AC812_03075 [Bellilinea caldifistulae]GAP09680.1 protein containing PilZ domain [Bellilinea caldifistulae]